MSFATIGSSRIDGCLDRGLEEGRRPGASGVRVGVLGAWVDRSAISSSWLIGYSGADGFDAANDMSPDETYVRIATGRDHHEAMPVSGIRLGQTEERLAMSVTVEQ